MALETGNRIEDLVTTNPATGDDISQGDDHLRLIKECVQGSFPSLGSTAVSATAADLNKVAAANIASEFVTSFNTRTGDVTPASGDYDIDDLGDVTITSVADEDTLVYDSGSSAWVNQAAKLHAELIWDTHTESAPSIATKIAQFSNTSGTIAAGLGAVASNTTDGTTLTLAADCEVHVSYSFSLSGTQQLGIMKNPAVTTNPQSQTVAVTVARGGYAATNATMHGSCICTSGDVIAINNDGAARAQSDRVEVVRIVVREL